MKAWIPLIAAIVLGLIAALMAMNLTAPSTSSLPHVGETVEVVTAGRGIGPGEAIGPGDLVMRPIAVADAPEGTFLEIGALANRVAQVQMVKGQPVLESLLAPEGASAGLAALVPAGMRAITVQVDEFSGLAGLIVPQARVDVLSTIRGDGDRSMARTIVQNVEVKAVGQRVTARAEGSAGEDPEPARSVTLLVTPEQAETIELAAVTGRPRLVLRGSKDETLSQTNGVTLVDLRGRGRSAGSEAAEVRTVEQREALPARVAAPVLEPNPVTGTRQVEVIRGGVVSHVAVEYRRPESVMTGVSIDGIDSK